MFERPVPVRPSPTLPLRQSNRSHAILDPPQPPRDIHRDVHRDVHRGYLVSSVDDVAASDFDAHGGDTIAPRGVHRIGARGGA